MSKRGAVQALPEALKAWRTIHHGWSQEGLAAKATRTPTARQHGLRVSPSTIAMIETGKRQPSLEVAEAIAEAMGLPVGAFALVASDDDEEDQAA